MENQNNNKHRQTNGRQRIVDTRRSREKNAADFSIFRRYNNGRDTLESSSDSNEVPSFIDQDINTRQVMSDKGSGINNLPSLKKSVRKLSTRKTVAPTFKRISQTEIEKSASPSVSTAQKRKRPAAAAGQDEEQGSPASKRMATEKTVLEALRRLEQKFDSANESLRSCAKKDDLTAIEISIRDKVRENERRLNRIESEMARSNKTVQRMVEDCVNARVERRVDETENMSVTSNRDDTQNIKKIEEKEFLEARKSMKMWPVPGEEKDLQDACRNFMRNTLDVPNDTADQIGIESIRRVQQARRSRVENEILVKFASIEERDVIQSFAPNLSRSNGNAGVRLDIPAHLRSDFRLLEAHGGLLRAKFKDLKRSIKFEDTLMGLVMDVRLTDGDEWERITPNDARRSKAARDDQESKLGRANPGGKAGRRALLLASPGISFSRHQAPSSNASGSRDTPGSPGSGGSAWTSARDPESSSTGSRNSSRE